MSPAPAAAAKNKKKNSTRFEAASFPVRRLSFDFSRTPRYWFGNNAFLTHFVGGLSALFPDGEMFFVRSVRNVRERIEDEALQREISAFIGQEAMHAKAHLAFDDFCKDRQIDLKSIERYAVVLLGFVERHGSPEQQLAVTCALEHLTATFAAQLLRRDDIRALIADPAMKQLWTWHAIEEAEHKAVAYDTYQAIGGGYVNRAAGMALALPVLAAVMLPITVKLLREDGQLGNWRDLARGLNTSFGPRGFFTQLVGTTLDYFRPGFHPNQHEFSHLVDKGRAEIGLDPTPAAVH